MLKAETKNGEKSNQDETAIFELNFTNDDWIKWKIVDVACVWWLISIRYHLLYVRIKL